MLSNYGYSQLVTLQLFQLLWYVCMYIRLLKADMTQLKNQVSNICKRNK